MKDYVVLRAKANRNLFAFTEKPEDEEALTLFTVAAHYKHPDDKESSDPLGGVMSHTHYHHVRDTCYRLGIEDMPSVIILDGRGKSESDIIMPVS